jgi:hypothetical protein
VPTSRRRRFLPAMARGKWVAVLERDRRRARLPSPLTASSDLRDGETRRSARTDVDAIARGADSSLQRVLSRSALLSSRASMQGPSCPLAKRAGWRHRSR